MWQQIRHRLRRKWERKRKYEFRSERRELSAGIPLYFCSEQIDLGFMNDNLNLGIESNFVVGQCASRSTELGLALMAQLHFGPVYKAENQTK